MTDNISRNTPSPQFNLVDKEVESLAKIKNPSNIIWSKEGFREKTFFEKIVATFIPFMSSRFDKETGKRVKELITSLNKSAVPVNPEGKKARDIGNAFFGVLSKTNSNIFSIDMLKGRSKIVNYLLMEGEDAKFLKKFDGMKDGQKQTAIKTARQGNLILKLNRKESFGGNKGATGSKVLKWTDGKSIGIFKPGKATATVRIMSKIKAFFNDQVSCLSTHTAKHQMFGEIASFAICKHLGLSLVTPTVMMTYQGQEGSFQIFKHEYQELADIDNLDYEKKTSSSKDVKEVKYSSGSVKAFQQMAILDFLIGNLDRKFDNLMVQQHKKTEGEKGILWGKAKDTYQARLDTFEELAMIDNANVLIEKNPKPNSYAMQHQYKWGDLLISKKPLGKEAIAVLDKMFLDEKGNEKPVEKVINELLKSIGDQNPKLKKYLSTHMEERLTERVRVLAIVRRKCKDPNTKGQMTPQVLSKIRTDEEFKTFL